MGRFVFHDIEQNSDKWYQARSGMPTSSKLGVVMANYGKAFGQPAKDYAAKIALEMITGKPVSGGYSNEHMERGVEQEPICRALYEDRTFSTVTNGGFFTDGETGCSPDGLVGDDGVIEIKSVIHSVQFKNIKRNNVDPAYRWQCIGNMKFPGREWLDFVSYCSDYPIDNQLFIHRILSKDFSDEYKMIDTRLDEFRFLIDEAIELIQGNK